MPTPWPRGPGASDISFNLVSQSDVQGIPLVDMTLADFLRPVITTVSTTFITARAAARHMIRQRSGVIPGPPAGHDVGGLQAAFGAVES